MGDKKRQRVKLGDVLRIALDDGKHSYAVVLTSPLVLFFDHLAECELDMTEVAALPVAFKIWVYSQYLNNGDWPRVGRITLADDCLRSPLLFKQDAITGALALYHSDFADTNYERPATLAECKGLERAAVWSASHVESRLRDHFAGRPNAFVESMAIDLARVPVLQRG